MKRSLVYLLFGRKQAVRKEVWDDSSEGFPPIFSNVSAFDGFSLPLACLGLATYTAASRIVQSISRASNTNTAIEP